MVLMKLYPWRFVLFTFGFSWILWALIALTGENINSNLTVGLVYLLGGFGPSIMGVIFVHREASAEEQREFWRRVLDFRRIGGGWWLVIMGLYPVTLLISFGLVAVFTGAGPDFSGFADLLSNPALLLSNMIFILFVGPISEELGWRGYMLDWLQARYSALTSSVLVGVAWWAWHLPLLLVAGSFLDGAAQSPVFIAGYLGTVLLYSVLFTWVYNNNRRSVLAAILMHFSVNLSTGLLLPPSDVFMVETFVLIGVVVAIILIWRPETLSRRSEPELVTS